MKALLRIKEKMLAKIYEKRWPSYDKALREKQLSLNLRQMVAQEQKQH